jgi:hypothetical protein
MDHDLKILRVTDLPTELAGLDDVIVADALMRRKEAKAMRRMMVFAAFISMGGGVVAGAALPAPAEAASPLTLLVPHTPLTQVGMADRN